MMEPLFKKAALKNAALHNLTTNIKPKSRLKTKLRNRCPNRQRPLFAKTQNPGDPEIFLKCNFNSPDSVPGYHLHQLPK